jgi:Ser/Thr protein kinase RdoA (MazF antagonist)
MRRRRFRLGAQQALRLYGLEAARLTFIAHSENVTYRVDTAEERFLLRMHVPHHPGAICAGTQTEAMISSELLWLEALRRDAALPVPDPFADSEGRRVNLVAVQGELKPVPVTLMRWMEGRFPGTQLTLDHCRRAGTLMAHLHNHSAQWTPPPAFQRPAWDLASFECALSEMEELTHRPSVYLALTRDQVRVFRKCAERISETMRSLGTERTLWGLIHADLHLGNLLFHRGEARAIDFSRCGYGHFVYDIAECCRFIGVERRRAFAAGYRDIRALPEQFPELLETFFIRGWIENFGFHAPNPKEQAWLCEAVPPFVARLEETYLRGEPMVTR